MERLVNIVEFILRGIGGGLLGGILGITLYGAGSAAFWPSWEVIELYTVADNPTGLLFVDYKLLSATEAKNNTVYLQTAQSGVQVLESGGPAYVLEALPDGESILELRLLDNSEKAPLVARSDRGRDYLLIGERWELKPDGSAEASGGFQAKPCVEEWRVPASKVVDSAGVVFSHALADEYLCYVLHADGSLDLWTRNRNAFEMVTFGVNGAIVGGALGLMSRYLVGRVRAFVAGRSGGQAAA